MSIFQIEVKHNQKDSDKDFFGIFKMEGLSRSFPCNSKGGKRMEEEHCFFTGFSIKKNEKPQKLLGHIITNSTEESKQTSLSILCLGSELPVRYNLKIKEDGQIKGIWGNVFMEHYAYCGGAEIEVEPVLEENKEQMIEQYNILENKFKKTTGTPQKDAEKRYNNTKATYLKVNYTEEIENTNNIFVAAPVQ